MIEHIPQFDILDLAYQVIDLHNENEALRRRVKHLENIRAINNKSLARSDGHTREMTRMMLNAVLDPDSALNKVSALQVERK